MARGITSIVEVWSNPYTVRYEKFPSIKKAMSYARSLRWQVSGSMKHLVGVTRSDKEGYVYITF